MFNSSLKLLLICDLPKYNSNAQTIIDHITSFQKYSQFKIKVISSRSGLPDNLSLSSYDIVVIHYSITLLTNSYYKESYLPHKEQKMLRSFNGLKVIFIQDEYRRVDYICDRINYMKIDLLFSCAPIQIARKIYQRLSSKTKLFETLTGYVPEKLGSISSIPHESRELDVFYRARKLPLWLGTLALDKYHIADNFLKNCSHSIKVDISTQEKDRLYGKKWLERLSNSRTTLGTESGASFIDFSGDIERDIAIFKSYNPEATFDDLPKHLISLDKRLSIQVISPRIFEAIACKTALILFPGNYSGILKKNRHYLELNKDFSNFDSLLEILNDKTAIETIATTAYKEIIEPGQYSYKSFIKSFDSMIKNELAKK